MNIKKITAINLILVTSIFNIHAMEVPHTDNNSKNISTLKIHHFPSRERYAFEWNQTEPHILCGSPTPLWGVNNKPLLSKNGVNLFYVLEQTAEYKKYKKANEDFRENRTDKMLHILYTCDENLYNTKEYQAWIKAKEENKIYFGT